ncbi:hypothetical protein G6F62_002187 [Rhizopus arrhizus]|nr:hypothetical protein G6F23_010154 [Rhizopus arrhizus]KAG1420525.1 hypothetical protein G6F58_004150 [Rhizopus delemar]KAG0765812.1 hypothetical protein G6F24_004121 [Rhizopus arrhizus]KAG0820245.1 hypothetical protein G6F20_000101 [Rhizopus arrhizus]KAG0940636.1 hypothetical protein G6F30_006612 [Rhizopus arrhizus]
MSSICSIEDNKIPTPTLRKSISRNSVLPTGAIPASESTRSLKRKKKKSNLSSSFVNPTDIFAQNLSDAVMDAEDSDDLEAYVYRDKPKHANWNFDPDHHYNYPLYQQQHPYYYYSSTDTDGCESSAAANSAIYGEKLSSRHPMLRTTISEIPPSIKEINTRKIRPLYNTFYCSQHTHQSGDEDYSFRQARRRKPVSNHSRSNSNWWTITMTTASFSVFASSHYVPTSLNNITLSGADPAEFLGTIYHLEDPLIYEAGTFLSSKESIATSQIRIKTPGSTKDDNTGNERWSLLIRYPYELTIRGVLKYQMTPFPLILSQLHTVRVCKMASVDPSSGQISDNVAIPEKSICDDPSPIEGS